MSNNTIRRLPVVLTRPEIEALLAALDGVAWIMAMLLYGSGLRLMECLRLRVKDIDFTRNEILVREGKGDKDRVTMLPAAVKARLLKHIDRVRRLHERDLQAGLGRVQLPHALARKYPNANREWGWQWVFPASKICAPPLKLRSAGGNDPRFGPAQRSHLHESVPQRAIREARHRAGIAKPVELNRCAVGPTRVASCSLRVASTDVVLSGEHGVVSVNEADAASLAKGVLVPNRTIVATLHETEDGPGSSGATVTWYSHRAPGWAGSPSEATLWCVRGPDAVQ